jgi:hypothetical protein
MAMFLATFARFVARAAGLHMRFVSARVAYADSFGHTHAQNGLLRRMFCTLGMGTNLSRTTNSNFGTLSYLFGANQIHSWRKPSRVRFDNDSIQISLNSISLRSGLAWTSAARPLLTYAAALLGPPLPGPYLRTYFELPCTAGMFRIVPICFFVSANQIPGLGFLKGGTE